MKKTILHASPIMKQSYVISFDVPDKQLFRVFLWHKTQNKTGDKLHMHQGNAQQTKGESILFKLFKNAQGH